MSIDLNAFYHSDYNTLINNVSSSATSSIFKKINPYQGILEPVELLDENYTDPRYTRVRYEGSKVTSAKYNFYTGMNSIIEVPSFQGKSRVEWGGDRSYGKTAAVDYNVDKFAFATNVNKKNLNFYDKSVVNLKYLIDASGSVTELSKQNKNLFEIQSMYKKGDKTTVSLFDKYSPSNQAALDGDKTVFEGGYNYSPILYREVDETLNFTYISPDKTVSNRLGYKGVSTGSIVWRTVGDANTEFTTTPNGTNTIFTINGTSITNQAFSLSKKRTTDWPFTQIPLLNFNTFLYKNYLGETIKLNDFWWWYYYVYGYITYYYPIDWFLPNGSDTAVGGYSTNDMTNLVQTVKDTTGNFVYAEAPRNSTYVVNVDIPIKTKVFNYESRNEFIGEQGPSIIKIVGIIEVQKSGTGVWNHLDPSGNMYGYTKFNALNIPIPEGGRPSTGTTSALVNEENSFIHFSADTKGGSVNGRSITPYFEGRCQLFNKEVVLNKGDRIRVRLYLAEVTSFFLKSSDIYFEVPIGDKSKSYFEVYDRDLASITLASSVSLPSTPALFYTNPDNRTITFNNEASLLYESVIFEPQDTNNPNSVSNLYSFVEFPFKFEKYDIVRFTPFYSIDAQYYYIDSIQEPKIENVGNVKTVIRPLSITLNRTYNPKEISTINFAFFRKFPDETSVMIDFKKRDGLTSNALLIPYNLKPETAKNIANIVAPLKDTILSKVLITQ